MILSKHLKKWRKTPFGYDNGNDCMLSIADYLVDCGYPDFFAKFRNTYTTEEGAYEHVTRYGGLDFMFDETDLLTTENPERGDIIVSKLGKVQVSGIHTGSTIALRSERGVIELNASLMVVKKAWKVEQCQGLLLFS